MLICIETHRTCDFPGGGGFGPPIPTLDPHLVNFRENYLHEHET